MNQNSDIASFEIIQRLRLIRSQNVGPQTFKRLIELYNNAEHALEQLPHLAAKGGATNRIKVCSSPDAEKELEALQAFGAELIFWDNSIYPKTLGMISDCPPVITTKGNINLLNSQTFVSIVGARNASINGINLAKKISSDLSNNSIIIVSGLAKGIDSAAHLNSLKGGTIAVIAGGINNIYPPENHDLYFKIFQNGLIISEYPFNSLPISHNFLQRNRIISGLSNAIVIIEASLKSGSLTTAKYAEKQNRKIFSIPGSPLDNKYSGSNWLIKSGKADLLTSANDIIEFFKAKESYAFNDHEQILITKNKQMPTENQLDEFRLVLHNALSFNPITIEDIILNTCIPYYVLNILLLEMELAGKIERLYGNKISRIA